jgi:hypothetical protein
VLLARRRLSIGARSRMVVVGAVSYAALYLILVVQALGGESVVAPGAATIAALTGWAILTIAAMALANYRMVSLGTVTTA